MERSFRRFAIAALMLLVETREAMLAVLDQRSAHEGAPRA